MDTRKLKADLEVTLHNEGRPEQWTEVVVDGGHPTMGYFDPPQAAELVRRWNAYPELVAALKDALADLQPPELGGLTGAEHDAGAAEGTIIKIRALLQTLNA